MERESNAIAVTIFTDPLCCWSWAFEPQLQQLKKALGEQATWEYRMGGLIPSWDNFHDNVNSVSRPAQMGPVWMHAGQVAGKPICHQVWINDPPASSYPSCIAVKCAQLQSSLAGEGMLQLLREACMAEGKNIARQEVLFDVARKLSIDDKTFDPARFKEDFFGKHGQDALRADLAEVSYYRINRFPALIVKSPAEKTIVISGYRKWEEVLKIMEPMAAVQNIIMREKYWLY